MSGKIVEYNKIDVEVLAISSAAGSTSQAYDMRVMPQTATGGQVKRILGIGHFCRRNVHRVME